MGKPKLSFDVDADKVVAIRDYIRDHAAEISFLRFPKDMKVTKVENATIKMANGEPNSFHVYGTLRGDYPKGDDSMSDVWHFSCTCRIRRGEDDAPVVCDLTQVSNEGGY